ncbi:hypothetical protein B0T17DRAFT_185945 [Bombardia bombarda]|uniref:Secreted protein n=1 Tax=Bombardia bombarda TaxID=252184 RepID=A0AA39X934_9PEZI|nr:hypothetical protein B0T17DRAFT_185945 [Bombardia bombarda]
MTGRFRCSGAPALLLLVDAASIPSAEDVPGHNLRCCIPFPPRTRHLLTTSANEHHMQKNQKYIINHHLAILVRNQHTGFRRCWTRSPCATSEAVRLVIYQLHQRVQARPFGIECVLMLARQKEP